MGLYSPDQDHQFACVTCPSHSPRYFQQELHAKIHIYNHHKRELKKAMDNKKVEWRNLLDFIRFDIPENEPLEEEEGEDDIILPDSQPNQASQVSEKDQDEVQEIVPAAPAAPAAPALSLQLHCPYLGCSQNFSLKSELLQHFLSQHPPSPWTEELLVILDPPVEKSLQSDTSTVLRRCKICPAMVGESQYSDHVSLHQNPGELTQCPHCLGFIALAELEAHS